MEKNKAIKREDLYMTAFYDAWYDVQKSMSNLKKYFSVPIKKKISKKAKIRKI